jgi:hypothetical protein
MATRVMEPTDATVVLNRTGRVAMGRGCPKLAVMAAAAISPRTHSTTTAIFFLGLSHPPRRAVPGRCLDRRLRGTAGSGFVIQGSYRLGK